MLNKDLFASLFRASRSAFGELTRYTHKSTRETVDVAGVFVKHAIEQTEQGSGIIIFGDKSEFRVGLSDFRIPPEIGDLITIRGVDYKILEPREENSGATVKLILLKDHGGSDASDSDDE